MQKSHVRTKHSNRGSCTSCIRTSKTVTRIYLAYSMRSKPESFCYNFLYLFLSFTVKQAKYTVHWTLASVRNSVKASTKIRRLILNVGKRPDGIIRTMRTCRPLLRPLLLSVRVLPFSSCPSCCQRISPYLQQQGLDSGLEELMELHPCCW